MVHLQRNVLQFFRGKGMKWIVHLVCYSHSAAISLGRSAPNRPKRLLLANRSKGEWLRIELKVNGYIARGKPVMWRNWCSLLVAMVKSAAGGSGDFCLTVSLFLRPASSSGAYSEFEKGWCHSGPVSCWPLCLRAAVRWDGCWWGKNSRRKTKSQVSEAGQDGLRSRVCGRGGRRDVRHQHQTTERSGFLTHLKSNRLGQSKQKCQSLSVTKTIPDIPQKQTRDKNRDEEEGEQKGSDEEIVEGAEKQRHFSPSFCPSSK